jgi:D-alanine transaminase
MERTVYLNGAFVPAENAKISIMDRGFLFSDGVYEVSAVIEGVLIDNEAHLNRIGYSQSFDFIRMDICPD